MSFDTLRVYEAGRFYDWHRGADRLCNLSWLATVSAGSGGTGLLAAVGEYMAQDRHISHLSAVRGCRCGPDPYMGLKKRSGG